VVLKTDVKALFVIPVSMLGLENAILLNQMILYVLIVNEHSCVVIFHQSLNQFWAA